MIMVQISVRYMMETNFCKSKKAKRCTIPVPPPCPEWNRKVVPTQKNSLRKQILLKQMLGIHEIWVRIRIRGSIPLTKGSGCGPDPAIVVSDLQDVNQKKNLHFLAYSFLKAHLHHFSKIKSYRSHQTVGSNVFLTIFAL
jgi:hypothetical protein